MPISQRVIRKMLEAEPEERAYLRNDPEMYGLMREMRVGETANRVQEEDQGDETQKRTSQILSSPFQEETKKARKVVKHPRFQKLLKKVGRS